jgi:hypothetical protein
MHLPLDLNLIALPLAFIAAVLSISCIRSGRPSSVILARWALWLCVSTGMGMLLCELGVSSRPTWATSLFCFLLWVLLETFYNWMAIDALSRSGLPLFPNYRLGDSSNEWPVDKPFIALREVLRKNQYHFLVSAIGQLGTDDIVRCPVYESVDRTRRIYLYFIPTPTGPLQSFFSISTLLDDGRRIVTDNVYMPYGGFYPENMYVERHPLLRALEKLLRLHQHRLDQIGGKAVEWSGDPVQDMNNQQRELEQLNVSLGFLVEPALREEYGNISREGRYRLWKEVWMLNYLGKPFSY